MTAPGPAQDNRDQQPVGPPPPEQQTAAEAALIAALALFLAGTGATSVAGATVGAVTPAALIAMMRRVGISARAGRLSLELAISIGRRTPAVPSGPGVVARRHVARAEPLWRAAYLVNAGKRITASLTAAPPDETSAAEQLRVALQRERRYLDQHVQAGRNRHDSAAAVDELAARYGPVLMWRTILDGREDADCRALNGRLFHIDSPPGGIYPGAMHPTCRCTGTRPPRRRRLNVVPDPGAS